MSVIQRICEWFTKGMTVEAREKCPTYFRSLLFSIPYIRRRFWIGRTGMAALERGDSCAARREWTILADNGDAEAQYRLARLFQNDSGPKGDIEEVVDLYQRSAKHGHRIALWRLKRLAVKGLASAQFHIGTFFNNEGDAGAARRWMKKAANQGHAGAQAFIGWRHLPMGIHSMFTRRFLFSLPKADPDRALAWLRASAEQGNAEGEYVLGYAYQYGEGVEKNTDAGLMYLHRSAEQDYELAQVQLAYIYTLGEGVPKDPLRASQWFERFVSQVDEHASPNLKLALGTAYQDGFGVDQDYVLAYKWLRLAFESGDTLISKKELRGLAKKMTPGQLAEAEALIEAAMH